MKCKGCKWWENYRGKLKHINLFHLPIKTLRHDLVTTMCKEHPWRLKMIQKRTFVQQRSKTGPDGMWSCSVTNSAEWDTTFTEMVVKYWFLLSKVLMKSFPLPMFKWSSDIFLNSSFLRGNSSETFYVMQKPPWSVIISLPQGTGTQDSMNTCKLTMNKIMCTDIIFQSQRARDILLITGWNSTEFLRR